MTKFILSTLEEKRGAPRIRGEGREEYILRRSSFFPSYVRGVKRVVLFIQEKMLAGFAVMLTNLKTQKPILSYA